MIDDRISELRELLNRISNLENLNDAAILRLSEELDSLILEYYHYK